MLSAPRLGVTQLAVCWARLGSVGVCCILSVVHTHGSAVDTDRDVVDKSLPL